MFGYSIARVSGRGLEPALRQGSVLLFKKRASIRRGNVVLVDHPDIGRIVCKIGTVGRKGNVYLKGIRGGSRGEEVESRVPREAVVGAMARRLF